MSRSFRLSSGAKSQAIRAGIEADGDAFTLEEFRRMRPVGRPKAAVTKAKISIQLSPEVLAYFKARGAGWQGRIEQALREWMAAH